MPAAIYLRISQDRTGEAAGVERQREDCLALAERLGLDVIQIFDDNDVSAFRPGTVRPQWNLLVQLIETRAIDTVVVYHVDRLYRRFADLEQIIKIVEGNRLTIHTVSAGDVDLSTSTGRMVARMLGAAAVGEVERKAERQARQKLALARKGKFNGGRRPVGYMKDGVTVDGDRAPALQKAAARIIAGHSLASCARDVSEEWDNRVPTPESIRREIKPRVLRDALLAPRIAGLRQYWSTADRDRWKRDEGVQSDRTNGRPSTMTLVEAEWKGILTFQQWKRVCAKLEEPERTSGQSPRKRSLLGGFLTCICGKGMGYSKASYKCMTSTRGCGKVSCSTSGIEQLVTDLVTGTMEMTSDLEVVVKASPKLDTERGRLQARYEELLPLWREGVLSREELTDERAILQGRLKLLEDGESKSIRDADARTTAFAALSRWTELGDDTPARAVAIRAVFDGIRILPASGGKASGPRFDRSRVRLKWAGSDVWVPLATD
jgi:site-specific DNA recombinase